MLRKSFYSFVFRFLVLAFSLLFPVLSTEYGRAQVIKMPRPMPDIVKEYKSVELHGGQMSMMDTGMQVNEGDYSTIMAEGLIYRGTNRLSPTNGLIFRIGGKEGDRYLDQEEGFRVEQGGNLYLNYSFGGFPSRSSPQRQGDGGSFTIDIIVWKKYDPVMVCNFLEEASLKDSQNKLLKDLAHKSKRSKELFLAEEKAKKNVEERKKAIVALKGKEIPELKETPGKKGVSELSEKRILEEAKQAIQTVKEKEATGIKDAEGEKKTAELTDQLQKATQALRELEELKKQIAAQKEKEKDLLARLEVEKGKQSRNPPLIAIASPKDGTSVDSESIILSGVAEDEEGIVKFEVLVNQQPATRKDQRDLQLVAKNPKRIDFSERIRLREGKNEISVAAQDTRGLLSKKTISIHYAKKKEEIWAVVIGISKYKNIPSLKYAANDARAFYRYLTEVNGVPKDHIWLILDEEATLDKLRSILGTQLRRQAGKDDTVIIYLAGHGATEKDATSPDGDGLEKYILPHNVDPKDFYASAMPMGEMARIFQRISSERLVFVSDTCYSGASDGRTMPVVGIRASISGVFLNVFLKVRVG